MNIVTRYLLIDNNGMAAPTVEIIEISGCYCVSNLITKDEVLVNTQWEAEAVASAMRNRNQTNHDKYSS